VNPADLAGGIAACGFDELSVSASHASGIALLPHHHRDPFDRLLVAQAIHESLHLLTSDLVLRRYTELAIVV
jgi:PIN domain nuclease of toxin-antitoxin system